MKIGEDRFESSPLFLSSHEIIVNKFVIVCFCSPCRDESRACLPVPIGCALLVRQAVIGREGGRTADNAWLEAAVK